MIALYLSPSAILLSTILTVTVSRFNSHYALYSLAYRGETPQGVSGNKGTKGNKAGKTGTKTCLGNREKQNRRNTFRENGDTWTILLGTTEHGLTPPPPLPGRPSEGSHITEHYDSERWRNGMDRKLKGQAGYHRLTFNEFRFSATSAFHSEKNFNEDFYY